MVKYIIICAIIICVAYDIIKSIKKYTNERKRNNLMQTFYDKDGNERHPFGTRNYSEDVLSSNNKNAYQEHPDLISNNQEQESGQDDEDYEEYKNTKADELEKNNYSQSVKSDDEENMQDDKSSNCNYRKKYRIY